MAANKTIWRVSAIATALTAVLLAAPLQMGLTSSAAQAQVAPAQTVERIVVMRHGEKPEAGLGQLACRGLARSLALPDVIIAKFGKPQYLFAPNPAHRKPDRGTPYDYIRPLATIEPLAIRVGLPVDVQYGFDQEKRLVKALGADRYANALVVVAWEHKIAAKITRDLLKKHAGDAAQVDKWKDDDFDRLDVVEITRGPGQVAKTTYRRDKQALDGLPDECPKLPAK